MSLRQLAKTEPITIDRIFGFVINNKVDKIYKYEDGLWIVYYVTCCYNCGSDIVKIYDTVYKTLTTIDVGMESITISSGYAELDEDIAQWNLPYSELKIITENETVRPLVNIKSARNSAD
jgi:hypothetical protein